MTCWGFGFKGYDLKTTKLVIILFILGRNFWTRNARKLIKVSKVTDSHLVSIENLSEILPSSGWAQARYQQPKIAKNLPYLWRQSQKTRNPKPKNFFHCRLKTYQVFWGFEQRSSAIDWGAMRLVSQLKYPKFFPDFQAQYINTPAVNVFKNSSKASKASFRAIQFLMKRKTAFSDEEVVKEAMMLIAKTAVEDKKYGTWCNLHSLWFSAGGKQSGTKSVSYVKSSRVCAVSTQQ